MDKTIIFGYMEEPKAITLSISNGKPSDPAINMLRDADSIHIVLDSDVQKDLDSAIVSGTEEIFKSRIVTLVNNALDIAESK